MGKTQRSKKWDKKRIIKTVVWGVLSLVMTECWSLCRYYYKGRTPAELNNEKLHYPYQAVCILWAICLIMLLRCLMTVIPTEVTDRIKMRFSKVFTKYIKNPLGKIAKKLREIFGLPEKTRIGGKDESSFFFTERENSLLKKIRALKNREKYSDLESNDLRVRFLYAKYILRKIKGGYKLNLTKTPDEICKDMKPNDDGKRLFSLYRGARFSGGRIPIEDSDVEFALEISKKG